MGRDVQPDWQVLDADGAAFLADALGGPGAAPAPQHQSPLPPPVAAADPTLLRDLLEAAVDAGASDLHVSAGSVPHLRVDGELRPLAGVAPTPAALVDAVSRSLVHPDQRDALVADGDLDVGFEIDLAGCRRRIRASVFRDTAGPAIAMRLIPASVPTIAELGLPAVVGRFVDLHAGLVLVTGPTGSGKSTTLAAIIDEINATRACHILTIEDPIEYRHPAKRALVRQREVGLDTVSFAHALRHALRQDPDVILLGELRDLETIRIALTAAETGHVVFATLHSADTSSAINRLIDVFPGDQQAQIRAQLALSLEGCVSQHLLPRRGGGRVLATEVLVATHGVRNLIREQKVHQIDTLLETGGEAGMHTFDQCLAHLVHTGQLDAAVARRHGDAVDGRLGR